MLDFFPTLMPFKFNVENLSTLLQPEEMTIVSFMSLSKCKLDAKNQSELREALGKQTLLPQEGLERGRGRRPSIEARASRG